MNILLILIFVVLCMIWSLLAFGISRIVGLLEQISDNILCGKENRLHEWERFLDEEEDDEK